MEAKKISINALKSFVQNDFKRPKGIERAHVVHRRDTLNELLIKDWRGDEWWEWYRERDYTILSTREENRSEIQLKKCDTFDIPLEKNLFLGKRVGYVYGAKEKEFLKGIAKNIKQ